MPMFSIPLSGLTASSMALSNIANNIANQNTVGYKETRTDFRDLFYQTLGSSGSGDPLQVGTGTAVGAISSDFTSGSVDQSGVPTDVAIMGDGFFVVQKNGVTQYTRAGDFSQNENGILVTSEGQQVLGYSSSQVDQRKAGKLAIAIQVAFEELGVFPASSMKPPIDNRDPLPFDTVQTLEKVEHRSAVAIEGKSQGIIGREQEGSDLLSLRRELQEALKTEIHRKAVGLRSTPGGLVISLREIGFFDSGSASLKRSSQPTIRSLAQILKPKSYYIRIEGHTDNVPIHTTQFSSNWELSTTRATEMIRLLVGTYAFAPSTLSAAGYAEFHPIAGNDTEEGRALKSACRSGDHRKENSTRRSKGGGFRGNSRATTGGSSLTTRSCP
jgi:chemotaxis protein MotB